MRNWIIEANQAENLPKQENLSETRDFLVSIGSNRRLSAGMLLAEFNPPWNFLAETNAKGRSPEAIPLPKRESSIWWSTVEDVRTIFEEENRYIYIPNLQTQGQI